MARKIEIVLEKRQVSCVAELLDDLAPRTCTAVWDALPLSGDAFHAKYARNEIYTLIAAFADQEPGRENPTITPIPGDVAYFSFEPWQLAASSHGYGPDAEQPATGSHGHGRDAEPRRLTVDLALFYGRNNLLLNPDFGWVPANIFATIVDGLDDMAQASNDLWRHGFAGETLAFHRLESH